MVNGLLLKVINVILRTIYSSEVIAEKFIPFDYEVSIVGARFKNGEKRFYPVTHNLQQNGILRYSVTDISFPQQQSQQIQAESMLGKIMDKLEYVGVMAMECFVVGDKLLINELAPRVHNSGHWTQLGCAISQFELHLRALLDLPYSVITAHCTKCHGQLDWYRNIIHNG